MQLSVLKDINFFKALDVDYKLYIVDDDPMVIRNLEYLVTNYSKHMRIVGSSSNAKIAIGQILTLRPDILFLDIIIPSRNGFEILEDLHKQQCYPEVVFISAYDSYAIKAFKFNAVHYIVKPATPKSIEEIEERLIKEVMINQSNIVANLKGLTWSKIMGFLRRHEQRKLIHFNVKGFEVSKYVSEIIFIKAEGSYSNLFCIDNKETLLSKNLTNINSFLPTSEFCRVHRSFIVNLCHIDKIEMEPTPRFYMTGGFEIGISVRNRKKVLETYRLF